MHRLELPKHAEQKNREGTMSASPKNAEGGNLLLRAALDNQPTAGRRQEFKAATSRMPAIAVNKADLPAIGLAQNRFAIAPRSIGQPPAVLPMACQAVVFVGHDAA